ncbi:hypothetical protein BJY00DRAFT_307835 [Aspergillus carlsbadensis]|nr:hypothetical protein BJY00DRAFT_307835 [Aspergillus carlsbadensis]
MSLNSLISWLSTISNACLVISCSEALGQLKWVWFAQGTRPVQELKTFDAASRGFYGALELIWRLRARHFAALGSLAVILAMAIDPFAQNLVHYYQDMVEDSSQSARMGQTNMYDSWTGDISVSSSCPNPPPPSRKTGLTDEPGYGVDPILKANVYNSLLNNDQNKPWSIPQYSCPSANCTWDPIASLETRALCTDVTDRVNMTCSVITDESSGFAEYPNCTLNLLGSDLTAWLVPDNGSTIAMKGFVAQGLGDGDGVVYNSNSSLGIVQYLAPKTTDRGPDAYWYVPPTPDTKWFATECAIEPLVRAFRPSVRQNVYSDETLAIWTNRTGLTSTNPIGSFEPPASWISELGLSPNQNRTFNYSFLVASELSSFIASIFTGQYTHYPMHSGYSATAPSSLYAGQDIIQALGQGNIAGCSDALESRLNCSMANVAAAITKTLRDAAFDETSTANSASVVNGTVWMSESFIAAKWEWISLPAFVWVLAVLAVGGTLWKGRRAAVPIWKNDPLPLLFVYGASTRGNPGVVGEAVNLRVRLSERDGVVKLG